MTWEVDNAGLYHNSVSNSRSFIPLPRYGVSADNLLHFRRQIIFKQGIIKIIMKPSCRIYIKIPDKLVKQCLEKHKGGEVQGQNDIRMTLTHEINHQIHGPLHDEPHVAFHPAHLLAALVDGVHARLS